MYKTMMLKFTSRRLVNLFTTPWVLNKFSLALYFSMELSALIIVSNKGIEISPD